MGQVWLAASPSRLSDASDSQQRLLDPDRCTALQSGSEEEQRHGSWGCLDETGPLAG